MTRSLLIVLSAGLLASASLLQRTGRAPARPPISLPNTDSEEVGLSTRPPVSSPSPTPGPGISGSPLPDLDDIRRNGLGPVNIDTGTATALTSVRGDALAVAPVITAEMRGRQMVMCETALAEYMFGIDNLAGPLEKARASLFLSQVIQVPDIPSPRVSAIPLANRDNDKIIFGTGDSLGIRTYTSDRRFVEAARSYGVVFFPSPYVHSPVQYARR